jgi:hypothetical protein
MFKSSIDYSELFGLRIFISRYKNVYEKKYGEYGEYDVNAPAGPQAIISEIEDRIKELENQE